MEHAHRNAALLHANDTQKPAESDTFAVGDTRRCPRASGARR